MSEMALTADQIIVIGRGALITQGSVDDLTATAQGTVLVRASDLTGLTRALEAKKALVQATSDSGLTVTGSLPKRSVTPPLRPASRFMNSRPSARRSKKSSWTSRRTP